MLSLSPASATDSPPWKRNSAREPRAQFPFVPFAKNSNAACPEKRHAFVVHANMKTKEQPLRKLIAITHISMDGVMQSPGGPDEDPRNGFSHGGWIWPFSDASAGDAVGELISSDFALLLGRRTYEIFAAYWPHAGTNPIGRAFNQATKYVATRSLDRLSWEHSQRLGADAVAGIRELKSSSGPTLHCWGSGELLQTLIAADLVDEYRIWVYPVILGAGKRLFEKGAPPRALSLVETRRTPKGVLLNTYRAAGPIPTTSAPPDSPSEDERARRKKLAAENAGR